MRLQTILGLTLMTLLVPAALFAADTMGGTSTTGSNEFSSGSSTPNKVYDEMSVLKLDGTIMVQHVDGSKPTALQTQSIVDKGDILTVYDKSWVILKTHKGDRIGLDSGTVLTVDESFIQGPDRQIRLLLQKGTLLLKTNGDSSRQSFFEINTGSVVTSIDELQAIVSYDADKNFLDIKYINGKIDVIDQTHEETFSLENTEYNVDTKTENSAENKRVSNHSTPLEHMEHTWENGKMMETNPIPMDELDEINYKKFFNGEKRLEPSDNNMLLNDSNVVSPRHR